MKAWIAGDSEAAAKVDPTLIAIFGIIVEVVVEWDIHTKLGVTPDVLLRTLIAIAIVATMVRSYQANISNKKKRVIEVEVTTEPPADEPDDEDKPDEPEPEPESDKPDDG